MKKIVPLNGLIRILNPNRYGRGVLNEQTY